MRAGRVELLIVMGGNPAYDAPADLGLKELLPNVRFSARLGLYEDETSALCHWHIPQTHFLEEWGDARAFDGTISIIQPLIAPLYGGKSACELVALLAGQPGQSNHDMVRSYWKTRAAGGRGAPKKAAARPGAATGAEDSFDTFWRKTLRDGVMAGTAFPPRPVTLKAGFASQPQAPSSGLEIIFRPDPTTWDGRFANNGWLQELPKPLTKLTWDSVAMFSPETARRLDVSNEDAVELKYEGRTIRAPVWVMPGHAERECHACFSAMAARVPAGSGTGVGFDAGWIRPLSTQWFGSGLVVNKTGAHWALATTQHHDAMEGRDLVRVATLEEYRKNPAFAQGDVQKNPLSLYPEVNHEGYQWGMAIDLNACTGCGACVVACQAENNIPVVGKTEVLRGREMHWIRIDRYYQGDERRSENVLRAGAVHALRERALRVGLPGGGDSAQPRGLERNGLQPLRWHPLLLEQLPVQGEAFQLSAFFRLEYAQPFRPAQSQRHRAQPRRHGEMHATACSGSMLQKSKRKSRIARCATAKSSPRASRRALRRRSYSETSPMLAAAFPN